jgi:copper resistance protein D
MAGTMGDSWGSAVDPAILLPALTDTTFGRVWAARLVLALIVAGLALRGRGDHDLPLLVSSGALLASVALTGHSAMPGGAIGALHQAADAAHLLAAGWWTGGLLALACAPDQRTPRVLARFSAVGYGAVAVLIATGVIKSLVLVAPLPALIHTAYGRVLLAKIALFAGMGLLALSNRFQLTPALAAGSDAARRRLAVQILTELALAIAVLALVGVLGAMEPPIAQ